MDGDGINDTLCHAFRSTLRVDGFSKRPRVFLFLQGPISPFFSEVAEGLEARGHRVLRVNLNVGDWLLWRRRGAINFKGRPADWPAFVAELLDREGVTDLVLLGEQRFYHREAINAAKARSLTVAVTDFGYIRPDWITLELDGMTALSRFPRDPEQVMTLAAECVEPDLSQRHRDSFSLQVAWDMTYHLSTSLLWFTYPFYQSHQVVHPVQVYLGTGYRLFCRKLWRNRQSNRVIDALLQDGTPYYVFPLQLENDFQLRAYSPYDGLIAPINEVVGSFARHAPKQTRLMIKIHPLDPAVRNWRRIVAEAAADAGVTTRVDYLDSGALDRLIDNSDGVVTINSTVGLWALRTDRPVKVLGDAVYDVPGLTFSGPLDRFWTEARQPDKAFREAYLRALAGTVHVRGVYYRGEGRAVAVAQAVERLDNALVNVPWPQSANARSTAEVAAVSSTPAR